MILLDTCVLFWLECEPGRISPAVSHAFRGSSALLHASAVSAFELGLKVRDGQLRLPLPTGEWVREVCSRRGIRLLPLDAIAAGRATELPLLHRDPCDRFLIATAQLAALTLVTPDEKIRQYPDLMVLW
jgi:PIN domain nuclease of toxin-antitoxin system